MLVSSPLAAYPPIPAATQIPNCSPSTATETLVRACEDGDISLLEEALCRGANPNARKLVQLCAHVPERIKSGLFFKKHETVCESKIDSQPAESALALAIRGGRVDIVALLLDVGADAGLPISWQVPNCTANWSKQFWETQRWSPKETYGFPSALSFALARGNHAFNLPGGKITVTNPSKPEHSRRRYILEPSISIVKLILDRVAGNPEAAAEATRALNERELRELAPVIGWASREISEFRRMQRERQQEAAALEALLDTQAARVGELQSKVAELERALKVKDHALAVQEAYAMREGGRVTVVPPIRVAEQSENGGEISIGFDVSNMDTLERNIYLARNQQYQTPASPTSSQSQDDETLRRSTFSSRRNSVIQLARPASVVLLPNGKVMEWGSTPAIVLEEASDAGGSGEGEHESDEDQTFGDDAEWENTPESGGAQKYELVAEDGPDEDGKGTRGRAVRAPVAGSRPTPKLVKQPAFHRQSLMQEIAEMTAAMKWFGTFERA
ncbi:hypothetical protein HDU93_009441 [Gonapodya sp. JEL0774]|nr:hypothetical protein HDU93_009441 [Gonapodya sp. JEL0774]